MDELFHQAVVNSQHVVCGKSLHPLCLWDLMALERYAEVGMAPIPTRTTNAEAWGGVGVTDLLLAVDLLSRDLTQEIIPTVRIGIEMKPTAARDLFLPPRWKRVLLRTKALSVDEEKEKLQRYLADYFVDIQMFHAEPKGDPKECNTPAVISVVMFLHRYTNLTDREIWTLPIGYILYLYHGLEEAMTDSVMLSPDQRAITARYEKEDQEQAGATEPEVPADSGVAALVAAYDKAYAERKIT